MPKMTLKRKIILTIVLFSSLGALYFALINEGSLESKDVSSKSPTVVTRDTLRDRGIPDNSESKHTDILFTPSKVQVEDAQQALVDIVANTHSNKITALQLELVFDPVYISDVVLTAPENGLFGGSSDYVVLFQEVDYESGKILYAVGIQPNGSPIQGEGRILTLSIKPKDTSAADSVVFSFTPNTMAVEEGSDASVIQNVTPLYLSFGAQSLEEKDSVD